MTTEQLYLHLMKQCLTHYLWADPPHPVQSTEISSALRKKAFLFLERVLSAKGVKMVREVPFDSTARTEGLDHPPVGDTMIGLKRLDNIQDCIEDVLRRNVPGDLVETGVWRGGATIFMRAALEAYKVQDRKVWVVDSFEGLPRPNPEKYPADSNDLHYRMSHLAVSLEDVQANFSRYGLLDDQVCFLKGWFKDVLPNAPIDRLAIMRLDGDMYESTMDALTYLYPKLSDGGYVIVDDYGYIESCRQAVHDFRRANQIEDEIRPIDWSGVYWQRSQ